MKTISSLVTGTRKLRLHKECQDAKLIRKTRDFVFLSVADGHGDKNCPFSRSGAEIAVRSAFEAIKFFFVRQKKNIGAFLQDNRQAIYRKTVIEWVKGVLNDFILRYENEKEKVEPLLPFMDTFFDTQRPMTSEETTAFLKERLHQKKIVEKITILYGTTLKVAVVTEKFAFFYGIGDGDIVAVSQGKGEWCLPRPEQFSNETASLCYDLEQVEEYFFSRYMPRISEKKRKDFTQEIFDFDMIFLSTDGLHNSYSSDESFMEKICEISTLCLQKGADYFAKRAKKWINTTTRNSVFQDDIAFVCLTRDKEE